MTHEGPQGDFDIKGTADLAARGFRDNFTTQDFWFTVKGDIVYAICLADPESTAIVRSLHTGAGKVKRVEVPGSGKVRFEQTEEGLKVAIPSGFAPEIGFVIKAKLKLKGQP